MIALLAILGLALLVYVLVYGLARAAADGDRAMRGKAKRSRFTNGDDEEDE